MASNGIEQYRYKGVFQSLSLILREEGARALYGGLSAHLMRVVPNAGVVFICYEAVLHFGQKFC